ncbi:type VI immunity family protein [Endozoicomonas arenosclerae]|uniref:type VI immunity family protein n=1 Tax=Endozoicomonas arenosclerae TaxID=1633495 RepID=UPI00078036A5|nr:type VI immunity family protein [Endozoicomonas arenosclerae]
MSQLDLNSLSNQPVAYFPRGNPAACIGLTMTFYFGAPGEPEKRQSLVNCINHYLQQAKGKLRLYAVAGDKRHRILKTGENPNPNLLVKMQSTETTLDFEAGGADEGIAHPWSISSLARGVTYPNYLGFLLLSYPASMLEQMGVQGFAQQFVTICNQLRVEHAYAGLGLITPFDVGGRSAAQNVIGDALMRYPGLDAYDLSGVMIHCRNGIKSINFLTAVSHRLLAKAGGTDAVLANAGSQILSCPYSNGTVFQAGDEPQLGSPNKPPENYIALGKALKEARAPFDDSMFDDPAGQDDEAFTQRWLARFDG